MKKSDYDNEKAAIEKEYELKIERLNRKYALLNNTVKPGDIVENEEIAIDVEKIEIIRSEGYPSCLYVGYRVSNNGKNEYFYTGSTAMHSINQPSVKSINGKVIK